MLGITVLWKNLQERNMYQNNEKLRQVVQSEHLVVILVLDDNSLWDLIDNLHRLTERY